MHDSTKNPTPENPQNKKPEEEAPDPALAPTERWVLGGLAYSERLSAHADQQNKPHVSDQQRVVRLESQLAIVIQWALDADADPEDVAGLLDRDAELLLWDLVVENGLRPQRGGDQ